MFLFLEAPKSLGGKASTYKGVAESAEQARQSLNDATAAVGSMSSAIKGLLEVQDISLQKLRSISQGLVVDSEGFRMSLQNVYLKVEDLGYSFADVANAAGEISTALGKTIIPSNSLLQSQLEYSKVTGISVKDLTTNEAIFMRISSSQQESFNKVVEITNEAQKLGLNIKQVVDDVAKNINNLQKFKMDDTGLTSMATQAAGLRTSIEGIGAMKLAETLWDPGKAVELSQKMQMYGGQVGKLGDSFQLMRMGAYDAKGLQEAMLDVYEQAFKIDEQGNILSPSHSDMLQLKAYAEAMGSSLDVAMNIGRERVKQTAIEEKLSNIIKTGTINEDQLNLIKSLGEIKDGKVELNIPGIGQIKDVSNITSAQLGQIKTYQEKASLSDKDLAIKNTTIAEDQLQSIRDIEEFLLRDTFSKDSITQRDIMTNLSTNMNASVDTFKTLQTNIGVGDFYGKIMSSFSADSIRAMVGDTETEQSRRRTESQNRSMGSSTTSSSMPASSTSTGALDYLSTNQEFTGSKLITGGKGSIQSIIFDKEDDFLAAPKLNEILNKAKMSFDAVYALNEMSVNPIPEKMTPIGETFSKIETTVNTNNTNQIKFEPLVIRIEGVDGDLRQMLEKGANASLLSEKIVEQFSKMPKLMESKGVFG